MKKTSNAISRDWMKIYVALYTLGVGIISNSIMVLADTADDQAQADKIIKQITGPINTLVYIIIGIMASVGSLILLKALTELINAIQQQDNSGIYHAGRSIAVGLLMMALSGIIALFTV